MSQSNRQSISSINPNDRTDYSGITGQRNEIINNIRAGIPEDVRIARPELHRSARFGTSLGIEIPEGINSTMTVPDNHIFSNTISKKTIYYEEAETNTNCCKNCNCPIF